MKQGNKVIITILMAILIIYAVLILNNQLESMKQSLDALYELLSQSRFLRIK